MAIQKWLAFFGPPCSLHLKLAIDRFKCASACFHAHIL